MINQCLVIVNATRSGWWWPVGLTASTDKRDFQVTTFKIEAPWPSSFGVYMASFGSYKRPFASMLARAEGE